MPGKFIKADDMAPIHEVVIAGKFVPVKNLKEVFKGIVSAPAMIYQTFVKNDFSVQINELVGIAKRNADSPTNRDAVVRYLEEVAAFLENKVVSFLNLAVTEKRKAAYKNSIQILKDAAEELKKKKYPPNAPGRRWYE
jgi:hypothetical protein